VKRLLVAAVAAAAVLVPVTGAAADPVHSPQAVSFEATCTGLGSVTLVNTGPAHTEALQVLGTNTVVGEPFETSVERSGDATVLSFNLSCRSDDSRKPRPERLLHKASVRGFLPSRAVD
jgi:hypothetical protein